MFSYVEARRCLRAFNLVTADPLWSVHNSRVSWQDRRRARAENDLYVNCSRAKSDQRARSGKADNVILTPPIA